MRTRKCIPTLGRSLSADAMKRKTMAAEQNIALKLLFPKFGYFIAYISLRWCIQIKLDVDFSNQISDIISSTTIFMRHVQLEEHAKIFQGRDFTFHMSDLAYETRNNMNLAYSICITHVRNETVLFRNSKIQFCKSWKNCQNIKLSVGRCLYGQ